MKGAVRSTLRSGGNTGAVAVESVREVVPVSQEL